MPAAWLWARADVRRRWRSLGLLAALLALALGSVLALVAGSRRAGTAFERYFAADQLPDVLVSTQPQSTAEFIEAAVSDPRIARVERAEMVVMAPAPIEPGNDGFTIVGTADSLTGGFGRPALVAGRYPEPSAPGELVVNERAATTYGFRPGQRVALRGIRCYVGCPVETIGEVTVVGVVRLATDLTADPQITGLAIGSPAFLDGAWREFARPASWLGLHVHDLADVRAVVDTLSVRVSDGDVVDARGATSPLDRAGRWQRTALAIAAAIVGVAGLLAVVQALARHLAGQPTDAPVLAAMGLPPRGVTAAGVLAAGPAVVVGIAGGVILAVALSPLLPLGVVRRADPDVGLHADVTALALGSAAAVIVIVGMTILVAHRWATRPSAASAARTPSLTSRVAAELGLRPVPAAGTSFALASGRGRTRGPAVPTVCVLACAVAVVAGALVVRWSIDGLIGRPDRYGQSYDVRVNLSGDESATARRLAADPRVKGITLTRQGAINLVSAGGRTAQIAATGVERITGPSPVAVLDGRAPAGPREVALASGTMATVGLHVGDHAMVGGPCGQFQMDVVGRVIVPLTSSNYPDDGSILTLDALDELCASDNVALIDVNGSALVRLRDKNDLGTLRREWAAQGLPAQDPETPNSVGLIRELRIVPVLVGAVLAVLGSAAAVHALVLTVRRRRHDLAVLRAFGLRPAQAGEIIVWQAATLVAVALIIGLPLGVVLGRAVWSAIAGSSNLVVQVDVKWIGLAALGAVAVAIAALLSIWPARRAARLRPTEALRAE